MTIKTSLELVRYIRHQLAGSEHQDVQAVEEFVRMRVSERLKSRMQLMEVLLESAEFDFSNQERLRELLQNYDA